MIFYFILTFAFHRVIFTQALQTNNIGRNEVNNKQLSQLIELLNSQHEQRTKTLNDRNFMQDLEKRGAINQYKKAVSDKISNNLQNILRIVQKNYDAHEKNEELKTNTEPVIFISNPEVLEEYKYGLNDNDNVETNTNQLRRKIERSWSTSSQSSSPSTSQSSEDSDDTRRNLKDFLEYMRKHPFSPSFGGSKELLSVKRRSQKAFPKREKLKDDSIEKPVWKEDKQKQKPKTKKDFSQAFDMNQQGSRNKKDFGPRKRPVGFQTGSKIKFGSFYRPNKERREDYRSYGRTSIPIVGKKSVYEKK